MIITDSSNARKDTNTLGVPSGADCVTPEGASEPSLTATPAKPPKIGRPTKASIVSKTKGHIGKRGRPPGEAAAMAEFRARLINSPKSKKVIEKIFDAALDDDHKNQGAAWKLIVERLAPLSTFEKGAGGKSAITINISGLGEPSVSATTGEEIEGELVELEDDYEQ